MKVFISWSGEASGKVAALLREHLPRMIQSLEPFMSKGDIGSGARWQQDIAKELDQTNFGIVCLTPENLTAPWLLFEAGALAKRVEKGRVCGLLLRDLKRLDVTGPLEQFQNRKFNQAEFWQLLSDLNNEVEKSLDLNTLKASFDKFWPDLEKEVGDVLSDTNDTEEEPKRSQLDLLEELLARVRNIDRDIAERLFRGEYSTIFENFVRPNMSVNELKQMLIGELSYMNSEHHAVLRECFSRKIADISSLIRKYGWHTIKSLSDARFIIVNDDGVRIQPMVAELVGSELGKME